MILGIDPGVTTAYVVRDRDDLIDRALVEDLDLTGRNVERAVDAVLSQALELVDRHRPRIVAVEAAVAPTAYNRGKIRIIDPAPIIGTAHLVGALIGIGALTVPPDGFGDPVPDGTPPAVARRILEASYPADLIGARETTGRGKGPAQHLRAAWDVAGAAHLSAVRSIG